MNLSHGIMAEGMSVSVGTSGRNSQTGTGTWTGVFCQVTIARPSTIQGGFVTGTATTAGSLCVRIYDVSDTGLPAAVNYKLSVTHF